MRKLEVVCLGGYRGWLTVSCASAQIVQNEKIFIVAPTMKSNPVFFLLELFSVTPATFAVLLFIHYL